MSIKFVCSCGKRLKARDDMAGKRIPCPRCGNPIGVPSLDPNQPTPMTPAERLRAKARRPITFSHLDDVEVKRPETPREKNPLLARRAIEGAHADLASETGIPEDSVLCTPYFVPSPTRPLVASPPSPPTGVPAPKPLDPTEARLKKQRKPQRQFTSRYEWPLETHWYQCVWYPFRAWPLVLVLAWALAVLTAVGALAVPRILAEIQFDAVSVSVGLVCLIGPLAGVGYACGFLDCVLASAAAGEARFIRWPGGNLLLVFRSLAAWTLAFLSAPAPLAAIGFYYWLYCGDVQLVDAIILVELGLVGAGYWILAVLAVTQTERLRDANPWRVAELAERLGWRALVAAVMAGVLFLSHGLLAFWTAGVLHDKPGLGLVLAAGCWLSGMYWATFVFRVVGVWWYYRSRRA